MKNYRSFAALPLDKITVSFNDTVKFTQYPFVLPLVRNLKEIQFPTQVTFFVGENGSGKSTLLEAIAHKAGFGAEGGSKNINFKTTREATYTPAQNFADQLTCSWRQKPMDGYFFRAESFYNIASYIDTLPDGTKSYGGKSLHDQSHGESFFSFFKHRMGKGGFFILDEPESALSPARQLSLLALMHELCQHSATQFIIATHSPLLLAYPHATIYSCDAEQLTKIAYKDTEHYQITKRFLDDPERYMHYLFADDR